LLPQTVGQFKLSGLGVKVEIPEINTAVTLLIEVAHAECKKYAVGIAAPGYEIDDAFMRIPGKIRHTRFLDLFLLPEKFPDRFFEIALKRLELRPSSPLKKLGAIHARAVRQGFVNPLLIGRNMKRHVRGVRMLIEQFLPLRILCRNHEL
jgi:hypothetical protein